MIHLCTSAMKRRQKNARRGAKIKNRLVSGRVNEFNSWLAVGVHSKLGEGGEQYARILRLVHNRVVCGCDFSGRYFQNDNWMTSHNTFIRTPAATPNTNP